jgi:hypothetical protein
VRSILVVVAHVFGDQPFQVPLVQYDHVTQQIAPATSYPTLRTAMGYETPFALAEFVQQMREAWPYSVAHRFRR